MRVIPVVDLKDGRAVRAVAGDRAHYQPLRAFLHQGADPVDLARAYRDQLGLNELYVADLNAIAGQAPVLPIICELAQLGLDLWVDAGVRTGEDATNLADAATVKVVLGLETIRAPEVIGQCAARVGPERLAFSLDLKDGLPMVSSEGPWSHLGATAIAHCAIACGCSTLIVIDLARVGTGAGPSVRPLIAELSREHPHVEFIAGGGVSSIADLLELAQAGAGGALVASALLDGRIRRDDLRYFRA
jgi:phosphoribosylformimino-5-aminoimidazole carboxamide ribotide isomerase